MPEDPDGVTPSPTRPPSLLGPVLVLLGCALLALFLRLAGSDPIILSEDIVLHGGFSFMLMVGGCFALRGATGILARGEEWMVFLAVLALGVGLEVVQHYVRIDSTVGDVAIDAIGATAGWAFFHVCAVLLDRVGNRKELAR